MSDNKNEDCSYLYRLTTPHKACDMRQARRLTGRERASTAYECGDILQLLAFPQDFLSYSPSSDENAIGEVMVIMTEQRSKCWCRIVRSTFTTSKVS